MLKLSICIQTEDMPTIDFKADLPTEQKRAIENIAALLENIPTEKRWLYLRQYHLEVTHQVKECPCLVAMRGWQDIQFFLCNTEGAIQGAKPVATIKLSSFAECVS